METNNFMQFAADKWIETQCELGRRWKGVLAIGLTVGALVTAFSLNDSGYQTTKYLLNQGHDRQEIERNIQQNNSGLAEFISRPGRNLAYYLNDSDRR